jgi:hypothetical protein
MDTSLRAAEDQEPQSSALPGDGEPPGWAHPRRCSPGLLGQTRRAADADDRSLSHGQVPASWNRATSSTRGPWCRVAAEQRDPGVGQPRVDRAVGPAAAYCCPDSSAHAAHIRASGRNGQVAGGCTQSWFSSLITTRCCPGPGSTWPGGCRARAAPSPARTPTRSGGRHAGEPAPSPARSRNPAASSRSSPPGNRNPALSTRLSSAGPVTGAPISIARPAGTARRPAPATAWPGWSRSQAVC